MSLPSKAEFQKATNLKVVVSDRRSADTILNRIDKLIEDFHNQQEQPAKVVLLGKLYYALEAWLKQADRGESGVNTRRKPAVYDFYVKAVQELSNFTGVTINLLPRWLAETFGKAMVADKAEMDIGENVAEYLTEVEVRKFRLSFRGGLAFQQRWWTNSTKWVLANSADVLAAEKALATQRNATTAGHDVGLSGYVLSQGGDFYTGPHLLPPSEGNAANTGRYHSSYFRGEPILCAGEIKIVHGCVKLINVSSGHYKPTVTHLEMAVETLALYGVNLRELEVEGLNQLKVLATNFLDRRFAVHKDKWDKQLTDNAFKPVHFGKSTTPTDWKQSTGGDTPAARQWAAVTHREQREQQQRDQQQRDDAFKLFQSHCKPRANGGVHGPMGRATCPLCKKVPERYWHEYMKHVASNR
jgi:hypothetical protein